MALVFREIKTWRFFNSQFGGDDVYVGAERDVLEGVLDARSADSPRAKLAAVYREDRTAGNPVQTQLDHDLAIGLNRIMRRCLSLAQACSHASPVNLCWGMWKVV